MRLRWRQVSARSWEGMDDGGDVRASVILGEFPHAWVAYVRSNDGRPIVRVPGDWPTRRQATQAAEDALGE